MLGPSEQSKALENQNLDEERPVEQKLINNKFVL